MELLATWWPSLWSGLLTTIWLSVLVIVFSTVAGIVGGLILTGRRRVAGGIMRGYVDVIRGIPVLVLLFTAYYASGAFGRGLDSFSAAAVALSIFATAHVSEIVRGGIQSLSRTTTEAAEVIGLTAPQRFRLVTVPLVLPRVIPPWTNTAVEVVKATSLASLIGVLDFMYRTQSARGSTFSAGPLFYFVAAIGYFVINFALSQAGAYVERRFRYQEY